ncbi:hypothetical protein HFN_0156 [Helicobacter fennelliae MRY12-0050]|uniref:Uncharacterized protein n=1 Tax=Helicobacter fennelliae MRY12-0050 TaxID=1325130 RepID=T1CYM4_9HELI|nr:hypothetical protein HFN_0156 [Helicobacter fennelliae MRY12-0050]
MAIHRFYRFHHISFLDFLFVDSSALASGRQSKESKAKCVLQTNP